jgi:hypothetical protein
MGSIKKPFVLVSANRKPPRTKASKKEMKESQLEVRSEIVTQILEGNGAIVTDVRDHISRLFEDENRAKKGIPPCDLSEVCEQICDYLENALDADSHDTIHAVLEELEWRRIEIWVSIILAAGNQTTGSIVSQNR